MRSGQPIPDRILHAPLLPVYLEFFVDSFWVLTTCRQSGMGEGPIPATAIMQYGQLCDCNDQLIHDLIAHVGAMDRIYLEDRAKIARRKAKK